MGASLYLFLLTYNPPEPRSGFNQKPSEGEEIEMIRRNLIGALLCAMAFFFTLAAPPAFAQDIGADEDAAVLVLVCQAGPCASTVRWSSDPDHLEPQVDWPDEYGYDRAYIGKDLYFEVTGRSWTVTLQEGTNRLSFDANTGELTSSTNLFVEETTPTQSRLSSPPLSSSALHAAGYPAEVPLDGQFTLSYQWRHPCTAAGFSILRNEAEIPEYDPAFAGNGIWHVRAGFSTDSEASCTEDQQREFVEEGRLPNALDALAAKGWPVTDPSKVRVTRTAIPGEAAVTVTWVPAAPPSNVLTVERGTQGSRDGVLVTVNGEKPVFIPDGRDGRDGADGRDVSSRWSDTGGVYADVGVASYGWCLGGGAFWAPTLGSGSSLALRVNGSVLNCSDYSSHAEGGEVVDLARFQTGPLVLSAGGGVNLQWWLKDWLAVEPIGLQGSALRFDTRFRPSQGSVLATGAVDIYPFGIADGDVRGIKRTRLFVRVWGGAGGYFGIVEGDQYITIDGTEYRDGTFQTLGAGGGLQVGALW